MSHRKWFKKFSEEGEFKKNIIDSIENTGTPLEFKASKLFSKHGYYSRHSYFIDKKGEEEITREIDLFAHKKLKEIKTNFGLDLHVFLKIIAECKFHDNRDLLVFGLEDEIKPNTTFRFPIFTNGTAPIYSIHANMMTLGNCLKIFDIPEISRNIIDVKYNGSKFHSLKENERSNNIFNISERQILPALNFFYETDLDFIKTFNYSRFCRHIDGSHIQKIKEGSLHSSTAINMIKEYFKLDFLLNEFLPVNIFIPLIIVNEDSGLFNIIYDETNSIEDLKEIKWCMYLHAPPTPEKYSLVLENRYEQPIIVCNVLYLEDFINSLEASISVLIKDMENNLNRHPMRIVEDIVTTSFYTGKIKF